MNDNKPDVEASLLAPHLFRLALQAADANMRRDRQSYDTLAADLARMVESVNVENDMQYRGVELDPEIP